MPRTPASAAVKLIRMQVAFALAAAPAAFGTAIICVLAGNHLVSYWWLALTLGWAGVPLALFLRMQRYARRVHAARPHGDRAAGLTPR
jgi:hypothetical protein